ncbi:hypothetical protein [Leptospira noguchii]|uniref:hypothetical protein n=1 Tax=Leptospira noguchii TaxID=28182 RepID=UPI0013F45CBA|nr:hypothetical protein [Leptospira noguchii]
MIGGYLYYDEKGKIVGMLMYGDMYVVEDYPLEKALRIMRSSERKQKGFMSE